MQMTQRVTFPIERPLLLELSFFSHLPPQPPLYKNPLFFPINDQTPLLVFRKIHRKEKREMSYYNQQQSPVGVPPPQGYPVEGHPKDAYPPPGYPAQAYPPPPQAYPPPQGYPQYSQPPPKKETGGFLEGCLAALCCCCLLDACF